MLSQINKPISCSEFDPDNIVYQIQPSKDQNDIRWLITPFYKSSKDIQILQVILPDIKFDSNPNPKRTKYSDYELHVKISSCTRSSNILNHIDNEFRKYAQKKKNLLSVEKYKSIIYHNEKSQLIKLKISGTIMDKINKLNLDHTIEAVLEISALWVCRKVMGVHMRLVSVTESNAEYSDSSTHYVISDDL